MVAVGVLMLLRRGAAGNADVRLGRENAGKLSAYGLGAGAFSGLFGIGEGFLIVPGLTATTGMAMIHAVGTSLVAVTAFGVTTAVNYALAGLIDWTVAACSSLADWRAALRACVPPLACPRKASWPPSPRC